MFRIPGAVHQRYVPLASRIEQAFPGGRLAFQLLGIFPPEFRPPRRVVAKPLSKPVAGRNLPGPTLHPTVLFLHPPAAIDGLPGIEPHRLRLARHKPV